MQRDKNGRYDKKVFTQHGSIEIPIPSLLSVLKLILLSLIFLPWLYIVFFRFDPAKYFEALFVYLFEPIEKKTFECNENNGKAPY